ncbi:MAG: YfhO family protein [Prevotella sp.]|nr:YfhO family protein [Prevotella sp.]
MKTLKRFLPDLLVVVLFAVISFAYFFPADFEGKILYRHDSSAGVGAGQEASEYHQRTGKYTRWSNSTFSGMPTYQTAPAYKSTQGLGAIMKAYHLWLPENVWFVFVYLLGFYILLRAFDFRQWMAALGAVVWAFSSYFFIIIAAGHIWKVWALAYLPPMIAGMVLAYRGKYLWGFILTAVFAAFEINANHVQMTYYYLFIILFMVIAWLVEAVRKGRIVHFLKATGVCLAGGLLGVCMNLSNLYHTWQYTQESMRGKSELVKTDGGKQTNSGLERDYITQWSYGIGETWTLLVPNTKGGASVPLSQNKTAMKHADGNFMQIYQQLGQYWGEQPGTSGPVYVGAFVVMLFVLGLFVVKGPMKWALLAATILSILLSWGRNFMPFTDFFLDYVPMYSKFRTVASILVIAEFTIPLLAMLALREVVLAYSGTKPQHSDSPLPPAKMQKYVLISFAITAGICMLFALMPSVFFSGFISTGEMSALKDGLPQEYLAPLVANLTEMRKAMFTSDCWRSFWIIVAGMVLLFLFMKKKLSAEYMVASLIVLCLVDMWMVNKRYLNNDMFVNKSERDAPQQKTKADEIILQDKSDCGNYRVLNLSTNTFNENETSYYHKSIGGYHAAKLRRYQDVIERYLSPEMQQMMPAIAEAAGDMTKVNGDSIYPVLNMLNMRYVIVPLQGGETVPIKNPYAYGNAWFVDNIRYVENANQELDAIGKLSLRQEAVADKAFQHVLGDAKQQDNTSIVTLTAYEPNHLKYEVQSEQGGIVVFSEIYYPGWTATVDGQPAELGRADYLLRALNVKAGKHQVELMFYPKSVNTTETIAYVSFAVLIMALLIVAFYEWKKRRQQ